MTGLPWTEMMQVILWVLRSRYQSIMCCYRYKLYIIVGVIYSVYTTVMYCQWHILYTVDCNNHRVPSCAVFVCEEISMSIACHGIACLILKYPVQCHCFFPCSAELLVNLLQVVADRIMLKESKPVWLNSNSYWHSAVNCCHYYCNPIS